VDRMFRAVDLSTGKHRVTWSYAPTTFKRGLVITLSTIVILLIVGHVRFWHPHLFARARR